ncbi:MAG TPA: hypothetical protein VEY30_10335 [Myxococcaceae bacterium]|nr:hypothetical protein [Myxococcaceae bacterium]
MQSRPRVSTAEQVQKKSGYQSLQPTDRPPFADADLDMARRPGVPQERNPPHPFPNTRFPPERQAGVPASPKHGRPNKPLPPVFGTSTPLRGLSGVIRRFAAHYPDHAPRHWLLKLLGDRVDFVESRARRALPYAAAIALLGVAVQLRRR